MPRVSIGAFLPTKRPRDIMNSVGRHVS